MFLAYFHWRIMEKENPDSLSLSSTKKYDQSGDGKQTYFSCPPYVYMQHCFIKRYKRVLLIPIEFCFHNGVILSIMAQITCTFESTEKKIYLEWFALHRRWKSENPSFSRWRQVLVISILHYSDFFCYLRQALCLNLSLKCAYLPNW